MAVELSKLLSSCSNNDQHPNALMRQMCQTCCFNSVVIFKCFNIIFHICMSLGLYKISRRHLSKSCLGLLNNVLTQCMVTGEVFYGGYS